MTCYRTASKIAVTCVQICLRRREAVEMNTEKILPTFSCPRVFDEVQLSGELDREPWTRVTSAALAPVQKLSLVGSHGRRRTPRTLFAVCVTETHLLLAFRCLDDDIWGTYTRRDDPLYEEEVVEVFLCPTSNLRHYYEFEVSPRNVVFDARVYSPDLHRRTMNVDTSWDCPGLETSVRVMGVLHTAPPAARVEERREKRTDSSDSQRSTQSIQGIWTVDMRIPFAAFPEVNPPKPGDAWRANFFRIDRAEPPEFTAWSPTLETPPNFHVPERFGHLLFE